MDVFLASTLYNIVRNLEINADLTDDKLRTDPEYGYTNDQIKDLKAKRAWFVDFFTAGFKKFPEHPWNGERPGKNWKDIPFSSNRLRDHLQAIIEDPAVMFQDCRKVLVSLRSMTMKQEMTVSSRKRKIAIVGTIFKVLAHAA